MQKNASNPLLWPSAHLAMAGLSFAAVADLHDDHQQTYAGEGSGARELRFEVRFYRVIALREVQVQVEGDYQTLYQTERMVDPDVVMDMTYVGVATTPTTNTSDPSSSSSSASTSSNSQDSPLTPSPGFSSSSISSSTSSSSARDSQATSTSSQFSSQPSSLSSMTPPTPFTIPHSAYVGDSQASAADFSLGSLPAEFALTPTPREHHRAPAPTTMDLEAEPRSLKRKRAQEGSATLLPTSPNASQAERKRKPDDTYDGAADAGASTFALVVAHQQADSPLLSLATPLLVFLLSHYLDYPLGYLDLLALAQSCKQLHHLLLASPATPLVWSAVHSYDFSPVGKHATKDRIADILFRCRGSRLSPSSAA